MCSIVGYIGKGLCRDAVLEGLERLEYRGYDSAGFACLDSEQQVMFEKAPGGLHNLKERFVTHDINGHVGIGHTRWSTHGDATQENAHPHVDCKKTLSIVHNGIIENHEALKTALKKAGHSFCSETDSEVIAHLLEDALANHTDVKGALLTLVNQLDGAYAILGVMQQFPDMMILVRKRSPLCIGISEGQHFVASDHLAFAGKTDQVLFMPDESFAIIAGESRALYDFSGNVLAVAVQTVASDWDAHDKNGHEHYMLKEIYEQKSAIADTVSYLRSISNTIWSQMGVSVDTIKALKDIHFVGCGTSWHAARIGQFFFEELLDIPVSVHLASELRYHRHFATDETLFVALSQSGETADTLEAIRQINDQQIQTVALTNVASSTVVRESAGFLLTQAGREIAVASTKAFTTQLTVLFWLAHRMLIERGGDSNALAKAEQNLLVAGELLEETIDRYKEPILTELAREYAQYDKGIFLGRHTSYPFAMEAALKLKEIAYVFAQCYPAGELKHGPLALVDASTPVFIFSHQDPIIYQKLLGNAQEVKARKGRLVIFAFEGQHELAALADTHFSIPRAEPLLASITMAGIMQFFMYAIAKERNCTIDKPRNLAKSVTVE